MKVYLDNSATSWPKPPTVVKAISDYLNKYGGSPGRSGHSFALRAAREVFETRELIAGLFNVRSSEKVVFSANATHALNIALKGILKKGDHVIITSMEHNSVIRPWRYSENRGLIEISILNCDVKGKINIEDLIKSFQPNTKLVATIHGSNVTGTLQPIRQIGEICKKRNVHYLIDAAQTAGVIPIDMQKDHIGILAFTGHKKLYGPPGIGGLCINDDVLIETLIHGGTGSKSEMEIHPEFFPDRLEAGTGNTVGVVGLKAGIQFIIEKEIDNLKKKQIQLAKYFINCLTEIDEIVLYGPNTGEERLPIISINIKNMVPSDLAFKLDSEFEIMVRAGLHCSPLAHKTIGTFPQGTLRFSIGSFNTEEEIKYTIESIKKIIKK
jgi:cysteine desulfurase / selenocysteine lyase